MAPTFSFASFSATSEYRIISAKFVQMIAKFVVMGQSFEDGQ